MCTVRCVECDRMLCVLFAALGASGTQHSEKYTHHTVTLNTEYSTQTIRSHSTQSTVHTPYGHTQHRAQYTYNTVTLNTEHSTHTIRHT